MSPIGSAYNPAAREGWQACRGLSVTRCLWLCGKENHRQRQEEKLTLIQASLESSLIKKGEGVQCYKEAEEKNPAVCASWNSCSTTVEVQAKQAAPRHAAKLEVCLSTHYLPTAPQRRLGSIRALQDERKNCEACPALTSWKHFCSTGLLYISSHPVVFMETYAQHLISKMSQRNEQQEKVKVWFHMPG